MLESISIAGVATYGSDAQVLGGLSKFNFVFGPNGSGKTTISRVISDCNSFPACSLHWRDGLPLQVLVYNRDFIHRNFGQAQELKGVFTLGEQNIDILGQIEADKADLDKLSSKLANRRATLGDTQTGKIQAREEVEERLRTECWAQKVDFDPFFQVAFEGFRNNRSNFKDKVLRERSKSTSMLEDLSVLKDRAATVFAPAPSFAVTLPLPRVGALAAMEKHPILSKKVLGREDVDIAALIGKLGSSDWVKAGAAYLPNSDGKCPFCQQEVPAALEASIAAYFDESFEADTLAIKDLLESYRNSSRDCLKSVDEAIATESPFIDNDRLRTFRAGIEALLSANEFKIEQKSKEASRVVELQSSAALLDELVGAISEANKGIDQHNATLANLGKEKEKLVGQVWKYLTDSSLKTALSHYDRDANELDSAIQALKKQITELEAEIQGKRSHIQELEKKVTSPQPTVSAINALLNSFGFGGFRLAVGSSGVTYKIVRIDGSDAKESLSEGERTFITFLYFYHLLKGSDSASGVVTDRVVVFDDPVSSLDSDILFIVGSLIKGLFEDVRTGIGHIKQVFVLTHNVYFHKEVSFNPKRSGGVMSEETFWMVRKNGQVSTITKCDCNPINTSYELLWKEIKQPISSAVSIQNTMRRILENYFKILGGVDFDAMSDRFDGSEKLVYKSLISWVNDGSHSVHDDVFISVQDTSGEQYHEIFKRVFEAAGHEAHYEMMMGKSST